MEVQDCISPMMSMRISPIPPTMRRVCLFLVTKPPSFWAMVPPPFFAAEAAVWDALPAAWAAPVPARWAAYCFCSRFFCHSREIGLLDASWGFSMMDFCQ